MQMTAIREHRVIDRKDHPARQTRSLDRRVEQPDARRRKQQAGRAADQAQDDTLEQQLADDAPPARAQRHAQADLSRALPGARQQEIGHVGAGDQQHEHGRAHDGDEHRAPAAADEGVVEGLDANPGEALGLLRKRRQHLLRDAAQFRLGASEIDVIFHAPEDRQRPRGAARLRFRGNERRPYVGVVRELQTGRHHADDGRGLTVDPYHAPQHAGVRAVAVGPDMVADDHHRIGAGALVLRDEVPAHHRPPPNHAERVDRDPRSAHLFRKRAVIADVHRGVTVARERIERAALRPPVVQLPGRDVATAAGLVDPRHHEEPGRILEGQVPPENRVHDRKADRVDADAASQHQDRRRREPAILRDQPEGESQILSDAFKQRKAARVAVLLLDRLKTTDANAGGALGLRRRHAARDVLVDLHRKVRPQLFVEVGVELAPAGEGGKPRPQAFQCGGHQWPTRRAGPRPDRPSSPVGPATGTRRSRRSRGRP